MISTKKKNLEIIILVALVSVLVVITAMHFFIDYSFNNIIGTLPEHTKNIEIVLYDIEIFIVFFTVIVVTIFLLIVARRIKKTTQDLEKYLIAIESSTNHIIITDINGVILYANKGAQDITGYSFEEMKGNTPRLWGALMPVDFYKDLWQTIKYERRPFLGEIKNRRKNQDEYYALAHISPIVNKDGELTGFVASEEDISSRKEVEENLKNSVTAARNILEDLQVEKEKLSEAKAKDEALLESIGEGVIATDQEGKVILMNNTAEELLGFTNVEVLDKFLKNSISFQDEEGNDIHDKLIPKNSKTISLGSTTTTTNYYFVQKNGERFPVSIIVSPVVLDSKIIGSIVVFHDITREKAIDRAKSEFASVASHQLRTPLTGIRWTIERILKQSKISDKEKDQLNDIQKLAYSLTEMVDSLLNIARIESSVISITPEKLDIVDFLNNSLKEAQLFLKEKNLVFSFKNNLKDLVALTDKNTLRNIFQSIIINAIEYTPDNGSITISLEKKEETFLISVSDTGIGIPKEDQKNIFGKFFRASNAMSIKAGGTGVGLYVAKEATKLLGGKIWFESEIDKGTTFYIEIPLVSSPIIGTRSLA